MSLRGRVKSALRRLRVYRRLLKDVIRFRFGRERGDLVYVDLHDPLYNKRYTYLLMKFLLMEGYSVILRYREQLVLRFNELKNTELIFSEDDFLLLPFEVEERTVAMSDRPGGEKMIHMNYFLQRDKVSRYTIPMPMHPFLYHQGIWNRTVEAEDRTRSVVFAGNVEWSTYKDPSHLRRFGMRSRHDQIQAIKRSTTVEVEERLTDPPQSETIYLLDKRTLGVGIDGWREFLARFQFFLALPGQVMPLCHNAVEAMSVGTVPIMHESYAKLFRPRLCHLGEVITYSHGDLVEALDVALRLEEQEVKGMAERARRYYEENLVPEVVVQRMLADDVSEICMCGEGDSVQLMIRDQPARHGTTSDRI